MLDIWIADVLLLAGAALYPILTIQRLKPRLLPGEGIVFPDPQTFDDEYRRRYAFRLVAFKIVPTILAFYFGYRMFTWPSDAPVDAPDLPTFFRALFAAYVFTLIVSSALRIRHERAFVKDHPAFADSVLPTRARIAAIAPMVLSFACVISAVSLHVLFVMIALLLLGLFGIVLSMKLQMRALTRSKHELPWDGALGARIAEVLQQFGHQPKKLILLPSMVANAYALPDGSVLVTSALRTLVSNEEVAATVAHELSHARDGEGKKFQRVRLVATLLVLVPLVPIMFLFLKTPAEPFLLPFLGFVIAPLTTISSLFVGRYTRPIEFKCDRDAARIGLGPSLASSLEKLNAFVGNPRSWIGLDRYTLTHPPLDERVAALRSYSVTPPPNAL